MKIRDIAYNESETEVLWTWERMLEKTKLIFRRKRLMNLMRVIYLDFSNTTFYDTSIYSCPSCGKDHVVDCLPHKPPIMDENETWTHYFFCPKTMQRINVKIELK